MVDEVNLYEQKKVVGSKDELDLVELVAILWSGRLIILITISLFVVVGFWVLKSRADVYEVDAILSSPTSYQLANIQPSRLKGGEDFQIRSIDLEALYARVIIYFNSLSVQKSFWEMKTGKPLNLFDAVGGKNEVEFKGFAGKLRLEILDPTGSPPISIRSIIESKAPEEGAQLLEEYLAYVDRFAVRELVAQLRDAHEVALAKLKLEYGAIQKLEKRKLEDQLIILTEARDLATSLRIVETPYDDIENVELKLLDNKLYLLGTRVLSEELKSLKQRVKTPLFAHVPRLREIEYWIEQISSDIEKLDVEGESSHSFVIVSPPDSSMSPINISTVLVFIVIITLSGILGSIIVFIRYAAKSYKIRQTPPG